MEQGVKACKIDGCDDRATARGFCSKHYDKSRLTVERQVYNRNVNLKRNYGLTGAAYDAMVVSQCGTCAICGEMDESGHHLSVDHHHVTRELRGLLCKKCNRGIGLLRDSPEILRRAADYLVRA